MPIYEYRCAACEKTYEMLFLATKLGAKALCPSCGSEMSRVPSAPAVHFKGTGWAKDGYSKEKL